MHKEDDNIHRLIVEDIWGTIAEEDRKWLHQLMNTDPEVVKLHSEISAVLREQGVEQKLDQMSGPAALSKILQSPRKRITGKILARVTVAAVACGAVAVITFWIGRAQPNIEVARTQHADSASVLLSIAGSKALNLSTNKGNLTLANAHLSNGSKTVYISAGRTSEIAELQVPIGKDYKIVLPDSTEVWLNSASHLRFPLRFDVTRREVFLDGEGYLKVKKDPARPFVVRLPNSAVEVLGTEFNVNTYTKGKDEVALIEGSVKLSTINRSTLLSPGKMATAYADRFDISTFDADRILSWQKGIFYFADVPLEQVLSVLPRWFGIQVVFDNTSWAKQHFTGVIDRNLPVGRSLDPIKDLGLLDYYFDKEGILHIK